MSVKGDPLLLLTKGLHSGTSTTPTGEVLIAELVAQAKDSVDPAEREPTRLYSRYVNRCLSNGDLVQMNAGEFYAKISLAAEQ